MNESVFFHEFFTAEDTVLAEGLPKRRFLSDTLADIAPSVETVSVCEPNDTFRFLHETAVIAHKGVLYAAWYHNPQHELSGYTPICGKRSYDGGHTWSDLEILCEDPTAKILYCPPVYGVFDGELYMFVNEMVGVDLIHALDLYRLNEETARFELVWSRPIPFKLNTNVLHLPNGRCLLPGRIAELDGFPNTPAVLISDSGRADGEWRLVKIAENGDLPDGEKYVHPEITALQDGNTLHMFCRNDNRRVPTVYLSADCGESWSTVTCHDVPYVATKMYTGRLLDGRPFLVANIDRSDRSRLALYVGEAGGNTFTKRAILFDSEAVPLKGAVACHYPAATEHDGKLYVIASLNYEWSVRGAVLFIVDIDSI